MLEIKIKIKCGNSYAFYTMEVVRSGRHCSSKWCLMISSESGS